MIVSTHRSMPSWQCWLCRFPQERCPEDPLYGRIKGEEPSLWLGWQMGMLLGLEIWDAALALICFISHEM